MISPGKRFSSLPQFFFMKKHDRMEAFVADLQINPSSGLHPCYAGYFQCLNIGNYYEAHDVLEHLWLSTSGPDHQFYKGLIQLAGAFVHLKKQHIRPDHPKDGRRLFPAARLFRIAASNLSPFAPRYQRLNVNAALAICHSMEEAILRSGHRQNPWSPDRLPSLHPEPETG